MALFDVRCNECGEVWEAAKKYDNPIECPLCSSWNTKTLMPLMKPSFKAKDPYDMIGDNTGATKKIKSFANDRRKGGKDTT